MPRCRPVLLLLAFLAFVIFSPASHAQYIAKTVVFLNPGPYPIPELTALAAVAPGDHLTKQSLLDGAARLQATGYFTDVEATLDGPIKAVEVRFKLKPVDPALLLPVGFDNFVWFTAEEFDAFRKSLPLLAFGLPEAGARRTQVQTALEQLLAAHSIKATVSHQVVEPTTLHPMRSFAYRVDTPKIQLGPVHLSGAAPSIVPEVRKAIGHAQYAPYNEGIAGATTAELLLAPWFDLGDLDAKLDPFIHKVASSTDDLVKVDLTATVLPGQPYHVGAVAFTPTPLVTAADFAKTQKLHPGDLASRNSLLATVAPATQLYHDHGYLDAYVSAAPALDATGHTVAYSFAIVPGDEYHVDAIDVKNLPANLRPDFDRAFPLHKGDPYNESVVGTFLTRHPEVKSLNGYTAAFTASADPNAHTVDLVIEFTNLNVH